MSRKRRWWPVVAFAGGMLLPLAFVVWSLWRSEREPAPPVPRCDKQGPTTRGIDVSYYQETIDWPRVRRAGIMFAFVRVSDGTTVEDTQFRINWTAARQAGVLRGAYQHFRPDEDTGEQVDLLVEALRVDPGELPPVIDVEVDGGRSPRQVAERVATWVERVRRELGVEPIIYTGPEFWRDRVGGADMTSQPLWLAHYTDDCPQVPREWTRWTFWQHSDNGRVRGIGGPVDLDVFAGDYAALEDFARRSRRAASR